jgi:hypothetical protein
MMPSPLAILVPTIGLAKSLMNSTQKGWRRQLAGGGPPDFGRM